MADTPKSPPQSLKVRVIGRPEGGALDEVTGQRAHGGVSFQDGLETVHLEPGDVAVVPFRVAGSLTADGLAELVQED